MSAALPTELPPLKSEGQDSNLRHADCENTLHIGPSDEVCVGQVVARGKGDVIPILFEKITLSAPARLEL